jgi:hypothetical protein
LVFFYTLSSEEDWEERRLFVDFYISENGNLRKDDTLCGGDIYMIDTTLWIFKLREL